MLKGAELASDYQSVSCEENYIFFDKAHQTEWEIRVWNSVE